MQIKQDPVTGLWAREDGAILMPPSKGRFKSFRWTFGHKHADGYCRIGYKGGYYAAHRIVCRAFHGLPPDDKPEVDHINRIPWDNRSANLRWADRSMNNTNKDSVDVSIERYGVRRCDDGTAYNKAHRNAHREEYKAHCRAYRAAHREKYKAYEATRRARMKAQGLVKRKGPDGKYGWYPRKHPVKNKEIG